MSADNVPTSDSPVSDSDSPVSDSDSPVSDSDRSGSNAHETPADETKRKFREALEAKKNRRGEDHIDDGQPHVHAHGPVDSKRVFRRKTG